MLKYVNFLKNIDMDIKIQKENNLKI